MTRAEQQAFDYVDSIPDGGTDMHPWNDEDIERAYQTGYEQAEKDLALTWQDIRKITQLYNDIADEFLERYFAQLPVRDEEIYQEVLRRYNEKRPFTKR